MEFKLPDIGEGVHEGELVRWLVKEGDSVAVDQPLVEIMTDKATVEIPSAFAGKVQKLHAKEGDVVKVGQLMLSFEGGAGAGAQAPTAQAAPTAPNPAPAKPAPAPARAPAPAPRAATPAPARPAAPAPAPRAQATEAYVASPGQVL